MHLLFDLWFAHQRIVYTFRRHSFPVLGGIMLSFIACLCLTRRQYSTRRLQHFKRKFALQFRPRNLQLSPENKFRTISDHFILVANRRRSQRTKCRSLNTQDYAFPCHFMLPIMGRFAEYFRGMEVARLCLLAALTLISRYTRLPGVLVDRLLVSVALRCKYYPLWDHQKPIRAAAFSQTTCQRRTVGRAGGEGRRGANSAVDGWVKTKLRTG